MNINTPHAIIIATHCKRLALRAKVIQLIRHVAQEQRKADELNKQKERKSK